MDAERKSVAERRDLGDFGEEQPEGPGMPTMRNLLTKDTYVEALNSRAKVARMNTDEKQDNG